MGIDPSLPTICFTVPCLSLTAAAANTYNSPDFDNLACSGIDVFINVASVTTSITVTLQGKDPLSGQYFTILASAAIVAPGFSVLRVFRGATAAANTVANDHLPRVWRIQAVTVGASTTATVAASTIA